MADQEHVDRLKQGVEVWNTWRRENPNRGVDLNHVNFQDFLNGAKFFNVDLSGAHFSNANLGGVDLTRVDLGHADLRYADLSFVNLREASLKHAELTGAHLGFADLSGANLRGTFMHGTILGQLDLRSVKGLETVLHVGPSHLSITAVLKKIDGIY
jgi:Pentapeptide repeats (8 copies)